MKPSLVKTPEAIAAGEGTKKVEAPAAETAPVALLVEAPPAKPVPPPSDSELTSSLFAEYVTDEKGNLSGLPPKTRVRVLIPTRFVTVNPCADAIIGSGKVRKSVQVVWQEKAP